MVSSVWLMIFSVSDRLMNSANSALSGAEVATGVAAEVDAAGDDRGEDINTKRRQQRKNEPPNNTTRNELNETDTHM